MAIRVISSPKYGKLNVTVDDNDLIMYDKYNWCISKRKNHFYVVRSFRKNGKKITLTLHRELLSLIDAKQFVDHIDGDTLNNSRSNLRLSNHSTNQMNRGKPSNNKSGYKGVSWHKSENKWRASITVNNKVIELGHFDKAEDAGKAYEKASKLYHKQFGKF